MEACLEFKWRQQPREEGGDFFLKLHLSKVTPFFPLMLQIRVLILCFQCFVGGKRAVGIQGSVLSPYEHHYAAVDQVAKPQPKDPGREGPSAGPGSPIR